MGNRYTRAAPSDATLQGMIAEYTTLQTARSSTIFESNGRLSIYLGTLSAFVVALAFIGQISRLGDEFFVFAFVLLPTLFFLGVVTYVRALQSGIEDLFLSRAMARIRRYLVSMDASAADYYMLSTRDDTVGHMINMGLEPGKRQLFYTSASLVAVINSVVIGVCLGLLATRLGIDPEESAVIGGLVGVLVLVAFIAHGGRTWVRAEQNVPVLFSEEIARSEAGH